MSEPTEAPPQFNSSKVLLAIGAIAVVYALTLAMGWPQHATELINGAHGHAPVTPAAPLAKFTPPEVIWVLPFCLLLACIAIFPLAHLTEHWWDNNPHKFYVAAGLGGVTLLYYIFLHGHPIDKHFLDHQVIQPTSGGNWGIAWAILQNAILNDYVPFIILLFSLYTISGGIRIEGDLAAHPLTNTTFLAIGAVLASFVGTTGAAMLLIRPLLETNRERKYVKHTVVFFIFVVCNAGGLLLPIGDPPLFLGYLKGVPFLWTLKLWGPWLFINGSLLAIYYIWDHFYCYPHETKSDIRRDEREVRPLQFSGLINVLWLGLVIVTVALLSPSKLFLDGTPMVQQWYPWLYLREVLCLVLVGASLITTAPKVRTDNNFNFGAIIEVAALFIGIFICMQPALQYLDAKGASLGITKPVHFFWASGSLSSVLDNAPTYLVFFEAAKALPKDPNAELMTIGDATIDVSLLTAISLGAVLMGAMTYIGNGPNFMVKAIAEKSGVAMPSFFGYMLYSFGVLLPLLGIMVFLFVA